MISIEELWEKDKAKLKKTTSDPDQKSAKKTVSVSDVWNKYKQDHGITDGRLFSYRANSLVDDYNALGSTWRSQDEYRAFGERINGFTSQIDDLRRQNPGVDFSGAYSSMNLLRAGLDKYAAYYGKWETDDAYNNWLIEQENQQKEREKMLSFNTKTAEAELAELKAQQSERNLLQTELNNLVDGSGNTKADVYIPGALGSAQKYMGANRDDSRRTELEAELGKYSPDLDANITQKEQYLNLAKLLQDSVHFEGVVKNPDFALNSGYKDSGGTHGVFSRRDSMYEFINRESNGISDWDTAHYLQGIDIRGRDNIERMTDKEISIYNYLYNTEGRETAERYILIIQEGLNQREADERFAGLEGKTGLELLFGIEAGLDQFSSGMRNLLNFKDDYIPASSTQLLSGMVRDDLKDDSIPIWYNFKEGKWEDTILGSSLGQVGYDAITTGSNMAPSILASSVSNLILPGSGAYVGSALMGGSAAGNAYQEVLNMGYGKGEARAYSTAIGVSEATLQYLLGGIGNLGGTSAKISKAVSGIDNGLLRFCLQWGGKIGSEELEEGLQTYLEPHLKNAILHTDESVDWSQVAYDALMGGLMGGAFGAVEVYQNRNNGLDLSQPETYNGNINTNGGMDNGRQVDHGGIQRNPEEYSAGEAAGSRENGGNDEEFSNAGSTLFSGGSRENVYASDSEGRGVSEELSDQLAETAVKSDDGTLIPMYHATGNMDFQTFEKGDVGFHFGTMEQAVKRSNTKNAGQGRMFRAYLNIKNPVRADLDIMGWRAPGAAMYMYSKGILTEAEAAEVYSLSAQGTDYDSPASVLLREMLESKGYDGIQYPNGFEGEGSSYIAFHDSQIIQRETSSLNHAQAAAEAPRAGNMGDAIRSVVRDSGLSEANAADVAAPKPVQNLRPKTKAQVKGGDIWKKGVVKGENVTLKDLKKTFNDTQNTAYKILSTYSAITGIDIVLYRSETDANGNFQGAQGRYDRSKPGTIYIDLNSGLTNAKSVDDLAKYTMVRTFAHEFTHFIENWNPAQYNDFSKVVLDALNGRGVDAESLIKKRQEESGLSYEAASREVVAEAMTDILPDSSFVQELAKNHKGVFQKLKEKLKSFIANLRKYYNTIGRNRSPEANALKRQVGDALHYAEDIVKLFDQAAVGAVENFQKSTAAESQSADVNAVQEQAREYLGDLKEHIQEDMTDEQRYEILKDKKLVAKPYNRSLVESIPQGDFEALEDIGNTEAFKILRKIGEQFGIFHEYENTDMDIRFTFSKGNLHESVHKQSGAFQDYARMMSVFSDVIENAVGIEAHSERYANASSQLDSVYVLVSAFNTETGTVPVLMEVKSFKDSTQSTLHVAVSLHEIERSRIVGITYNDISDDASIPLPASEFNVAEFFKNVNPLDARLIKYIPDNFLDSAQMKAKMNAFKEQEEYIAKKNAKYFGTESQNQERSTPLTDLDILEAAAKDVGDMKLTEGERQALSSVQKRFQEISEARKRIAEIQAKEDLTIQDKNRIGVFEGKINRLSKELWNISQYSVSKALAEKARPLLVERYGAIKPGANPARAVEVPKRTSKDTKVSQTVRTVMEAASTTEEMVGEINQKVVQGGFSYIPVDDNSAKEYADKVIQRKGWQEAYNDWFKDMGAGKANKHTVTLGFQLYNNAVNAGDTQAAIKILSEITGTVRQSAQVVQAVSILKKLSPENRLYAVQVQLNGIQDMLDKKYGDKAPQIDFNSELAKAYVNAKTQEEINIAEKNLYRDIAMQIPHTFADIWRSWRYLSMLCNLKTLIRNFVGNAGFVLVRAPKDYMAAGFEKFLPQEKRTKTFTKDKGLYAWAKADFESFNEMMDSAGKYSDTMSKIEKLRPAFGSRDLVAKGLSKIADKNSFTKKLSGVADKYNLAKGLSWLSDKNSAALEWGDKVFKKPAYAKALAMYLENKGVTVEDLTAGKVSDKVLNEARDIAYREALRATFNDFNDFSDWVAKIGRKADSNWVAKTASFATDGVIPYRRTPANVVVRAVEYSPIGFFNSITKGFWDVKHDNMTAAECMDRIACGLTGSILLGLGAFFAYKGWATGNDDEDDKQAAFDRLRGKQCYSLVIGDTSYTLDWLAPEALPFFVGVELYKKSQDGTDFSFWDVLDVVGNISEPMLEMSMLSGAQELLDNVSYADDKVTAILASMATSHLTQALPTIFGQIERTTETEREQTFIDRNTEVPRDLQYILAKSMNKLPGEYDQIPYIDAWGRREETGNVWERMLSNMVSPGYLSTDSSTAFDDELQRLYDAGYENVLPSRVKQSQQVEGSYLTAEQYVAYAETKGKTQYGIVEEMTKSKWYESLSDFDRAECIAAAYEYANALGKQAANKDYEPESWIKEANAGKDVKLSVARYIHAKNEITGITGMDSTGKSVANLKGLRVMDAVNSIPGLTEAQRKYLYKCFDVGKKVIELSESEVKAELRKLDK